MLKQEQADGWDTGVITQPTCKVIPSSISLSLTHTHTLSLPLLSLSSNNGTRKHHTEHNFTPATSMRAGDYFTPSPQHSPFSTHHTFTQSFNVYTLWLYLYTPTKLSCYNQIKWNSSCDCRCKLTCMDTVYTLTCRLLPLTYCARVPQSAGYYEAVPIMRLTL